MATETPRSRTARRYGSAKAHRDAHPRKKKAAFDNGVTGRTERRWGSPQDAQGSPLEAFTRYLATAQDPYRILAHNRASVMQKHLGRLSNREIIDRIHQLQVEDAEGEGVDNANRSRRGVSPADRAVAHERDAATDLELAALWREADARGITEADVLGGWS